MLITVIDWVLSVSGDLGDRGFVGQAADFSTRRNPPKELAERMRGAGELFPCDLLFVHRDAEREPLEARVAEIESAAASMAIDELVPVVPVRMTEAWLLFDLPAIRQAAGNPSGGLEIAVPELDQVESEPDPKTLLREALLAASEKKGRRRSQLKRDLGRRVQRVGEYIEDFSPLRQLPAFRRFEAETRKVLHRIGGAR